MKQISIRIRLFITLMVVFLLPVTVLGAVGLNWMTNSLQQNAIKSVSGALESVVDRLDGGLDAVESTVVQISQNSLVYRLTWMRGDKLDTSRVSMSDILDYRKELLFLGQTSDFYSRVCLCFPSKDFAISSLGPWDLSYFLEDEFRIQDLSSEDWKAIFAGSNTAYLPNGPLSTFGYEQQGLVIVRCAERNGQGDALIVMLFWVNETTLEQLFDDLLLFPGTAVEVYAPDGQRVYCISGSGEGEQIQLTRTSQQSGWQYAVHIPKAEIYATTRPFRVTCSIIFIAVFILGGILSFELMQVNYRPFARVIRSLNLDIGRATPRDIEMAERMLSDLIAEQGQLRQRAAESSEMLRYAAISHILNGDADEKISNICDVLDLRFPYPLFSVCVLDGPQVGQTDMLLQACHDAGMRAWSIRLQGRPTLLINHSQPQLDALHIQGVSAGLSNPREGMGDLSAAVAEAYRASRYRHPDGADGIVFYAEIAHKRQLIYYPPERERELSAALCVGNEDAAVACFDSLVERNDPPAIVGLVAAVYLTVMHTDNAAGVVGKAVNAIEPPRSDDTAEQTNYARALLRAAAACNQRQVQARKSEFLSKLLFYIDEHLSDPGLSLASISEAFDLSSAYLSRYFKEQMHVNYLDYVNKLRIEAARDLLRSGRCTVKNAAAEVGFVSDATFRRLYKKYQGILPSQEQPDDR